LEARLTRTTGELSQLVDSNRPSDRDTLNLLVRTFTDLSGQLLELSLAQAGARLESITFEPIELTNEQALAIAAAYRQDWMNARAALVDSWRLIYFNANDLRSDLDIVFSGDVRNQDDNPFSLSSARGNLRVGLQFDGALTRVAERNIYRQSLIEFQQARRTYYQFRDNVYFDLRNTLRQIRLNELNFELRRAAVQTAISQVDLTQMRLSEPPQPGETAVFDNNTARDLVQALGDLLNVQNDFLSVWVNHYVQHLGLELDLGLMDVAPNGLRIENNVPFQTYLIGLPCNSADMGLAAQRLDLTGPANLSQPEALEPVWPLPVEQVPAEPLPVEENDLPAPDDPPPMLPDEAAADDGVIHASAAEPLTDADLPNPLRQQKSVAEATLVPLAFPVSPEEFRNTHAQE
jgi:hypothetical protein